MYDNAECGKVCEPPRETIADLIHSTKGALVELLLLIGDIGNQLYCDEPDTSKPPEGKCLQDDVRMIDQMSKVAIEKLLALRQRMI